MTSSSRKSLKTSRGTEVLSLNPGDHVYVLLADNKSKTANEIAKIISILPAKKPATTSNLKVRWYITSAVLPKRYDKDRKFFSANELFETTQEDVIPAESVNGKCSVIPFEEYSELHTVDPDVYFTRATFNYSSKKLSPEPEKWPRYCICNKPMNPDLAYVQCDKCSKWFHLSCLNSSKADMAQETFVCPNCQLPADAKKEDRELMEVPFTSSSNSTDTMLDGLSSSSKKIKKENRTRTAVSRRSAASSTSAKWSAVDQLFLRLGFNPQLPPQQVEKDLAVLRLSAKEIAPVEEQQHPQQHVKEVREEFHMTMHEYNTNCDTA